MLDNLEICEMVRTAYHRSRDNHAIAAALNALGFAAPYGGQRWWPEDVLVLINQGAPDYEGCSLNWRR